MQSNDSERATAQNLLESISGYVDDLAHCTDAVRLSDAVQNFLTACARFHRYSWNNMLMIMLAQPDARHVAGFQTWKKLGRFVKRGEHGIAILVPILLRSKVQAEVRAEDAASKSGQEPATPASRVGFKVGYVFDVSQTEGKDLPPLPDWRSPARQEVLHARLITFAESLGITVRTGELHGNAEGASHGGAITLRERAGTETLIHELAHELLHRTGERVARKTAEIDAESVGYVVGCHYGLEGLNCPTYLALWGADANAIRDRFKAITTCAARIIAGVESGDATASNPVPDPVLSINDSNSVEPMIA